MKSAYFMLLGFFIFMLILVNSVFIMAFSPRYYGYQHNKIGIYEKYDRHMVEDITDQVIGYIKSDIEDLYYDDGEGNNLFTEREVLHMEDVRGLFEFYAIARILAVIVLGISAVCFRNDIESLLRGAVKGIWGGMCIMGSAAILAYLNFGYAFKKFHEFFFRNELWILDKNESIVINIFPADFFVRISVHIFLLAFVSAGICAIMLGFIRKRI